MLTPALTALRKPSRWASVVSRFLRRISSDQPSLAADGVDVVAVVDVGDQPGAVLLHQRDAFVVDQRAVLDRAHAGAHRALDAFGAVRVRGDEGAAAARLPRPRRGSRLRCIRTAPGSVPAVSTAPVAITLMKSAPWSSSSFTCWRTSRLVVGDAAAELVGHHRALGQPGDFAAAAGDGDVGAGDEHARPGHVAGVDRVAQGDVGEAAVDADVAHGGEAGAHGVAGIPRADEGIARRGALQRRGRRRRTGLRRPGACACPSGRAARCSATSRGPWRRRRPRRRTARRW